MLQKIQIREMFQLIQKIKQYYKKINGLLGQIVHKSLMCKIQLIHNVHKHLKIIKQCFKEVRNKWVGSNAHESLIFKTKWIHKINMYLKTIRVKYFAWQLCRRTNKQKKRVNRAQARTIYYIKIQSIFEKYFLTRIVFLIPLRILIVTIWNNFLIIIKMYPKLTILISFILLIFSINIQHFLYWQGHVTNELDSIKLALDANVSTPFKQQAITQFPALRSDKTHIPNNSVLSSNRERSNPLFNTAQYWRPQSASKLLDIITNYFINDHKIQDSLFRVNNINKQMSIMKEQQESVIQGLMSTKVVNNEVQEQIVVNQASIVQESVPDVLFDMREVATLSESPDDLHAQHMAQRVQVRAKIIEEKSHHVWHAGAVKHSGESGFHKGINIGGDAIAEARLRKKLWGLAD